MSGIINPFARPDTTTVDETGPEIRLLVCSQCRTIEMLEDYTGPPERAEDFDVILNVALDRHKDGVERRPHIGQLFRVRKSSWDSPEAQDQIVRQINERFNPGAETGLGSQAYALRDNFQADAMRCWTVKHNRTPACSDYKTEKMQLVPNTQAERRDLGMPKFERGNPATQRYLCEYCPVNSLVMQARREKAGLYDQ